MVPESGTAPGVSDIRVATDMTTHHRHSTEIHGSASEIASALSLAELRAELRVQAQAADECLRFTLAEAISIAALQGYWESLTKKLPLRTPPRAAGELSESLVATSRRLGEIMAPLPVAHAAYHLSLLYTGLLRPEWRAKHGVYYTPPTLANRLLDQAEAAGLDWSKAHILDPAAGAAAFLIPAAARLMKTLGACTPAVAIRNISARIRGYEVDPFAAWMGQVFIEAAILPVLTLAHRRPDCITVCDSLKTANSSCFRPCDRQSAVRKGIAGRDAAATLRAQPFRSRQPVRTVHRSRGRPRAPERPHLIFDAVEFSRR